MASPRKTAAELAAAAERRRARNIASQRRRREDEEYRQRERERDRAARQRRRREDVAYLQRERERNAACHRAAREKRRRQEQERNSLAGQDSARCLESQAAEKAAAAERRRARNAASQRLRREDEAYRLREKERNTAQRAAREKRRQQEHTSLAAQNLDHCPERGDQDGETDTQWDNVDAAFLTEGPTEVCHLYENAAERQRALNTASDIPTAMMEHGASERVAEQSHTQMTIKTEVEESVQSTAYIDIEINVNYIKEEPGFMEPGKSEPALSVKEEVVEDGFQETHMKSMTYNCGKDCTPKRHCQKHEESNECTHLTASDKSASASTSTQQYNVVAVKVEPADGELDCNFRPQKQEPQID